jgi:hypothetical protein
LSTLRRIAAGLASLCLAGTALGGALPAAGTTGSAAVSGCVGTGFSGTLGPNKAICNGNFLVRMQTNGDLVLRVVSTGRACWTSGTGRAPGADTSVTFHQNPIGAPYIDIDSASQGRLRRITGAHGLTQLGSTASVNTRGEFWVGFKKIASC